MFGDNRLPRLGDVFTVAQLAEELGKQTVVLRFERHLHLAVEDGSHFFLGHVLTPKQMDFIDHLCKEGYLAVSEFVIERIGFFREYFNELF